MQRFIMTLLICSLTMSVLALLYMAITPVLAKRYSAKSRYYAWLVIVLGFIIPFKPQFSYAMLKVDIPIETLSPIIQIGKDTPFVLPSQNTALPTVLPSISMWQMIAVVWLVGMVATFAYYTIKHYRFKKMVKRWSESVSDKQVLSLFLSLKSELAINRQIDLELCSCIGSPMLVGVVKPTILIPHLNFAKDELRFILHHELVHFKRKDLWYKCFMFLATAMHWFNPIVYVIAKAIDVQCELSCDAEVVQSTNQDMRLHYSETIIGVIQYNSKRNTALSTKFYGGKEDMKKRIFSIMDMNRKKAGLAVICGTLIVTLGTGAAFAANAQPDFPTHPRFPDHPSFPSVQDNSSPSPEIEIGDSLKKEDSGTIMSNSKKIRFDIQSVAAGENIMLGGYRLQKGDTVQVEYSNNGNKINISMCTDNLRPTETAIAINTTTEVQKDGVYYFFIQSNATNGASNDIRGTIQLNYRSPQMVQDERVQFTDNEASPNESRTVNRAEVPAQETANNKSQYDGLFDDPATVLHYFDKSNYNAESYKENQHEGATSLVFTNFSGSKTIYELNLSQATTVDFGISADVDGEYKIAFITENREVAMTAATYNWFPASRPIELPKGKTAIVLIGEQATGSCNLSLNY